MRLSCLPNKSAFNLAPLIPRLKAISTTECTENFKERSSYHITRAENYFL